MQAPPHLLKLAVYNDCGVRPLVRSSFCPYFVSATVPDRLTILCKFSQNITHILLHLLFHNFIWLFLGLLYDDTDFVNLLKLSQNLYHIAPLCIPLYCFGVSLSRAWTLSFIIYLFLLGGVPFSIRNSS